MPSIPQKTDDTPLTQPLPQAPTNSEPFHTLAREEWLFGRPASHRISPRGGAHLPFRFSLSTIVGLTPWENTSVLALTKRVNFCADV
jgi:hypothetical protein